MTRGRCVRNPTDKRRNHINELIIATYLMKNLITIKAMKSATMPQMPRAIKVVIHVMAG